MAPDHDLSGLPAPKRKDLKQFGSLWVRAIQAYDPELDAVGHYDFIYFRYTTLKGKVEFRLARIAKQEPKVP